MKPPFLFRLLHFVPVIVLSLLPDLLHAEGLPGDSDNKRRKDVLLVIARERDHFDPCMIPVGGDMETIPAELGDAVDGAESEGWISPELSRGMLISFVASASAETILKGYRYHRTAGVWPWALGLKDVGSIAEAAAWSGGISAVMSSVSYGVSKTTGLWKPAAVLLVGGAVRTARVLYRYWNEQIEHEQLPAELAWVMLKTGTITGAGYLFSVGASQAYRYFTIPGAVAGGMLGNIMLEQARSILESSSSGL